MLQKQPVNINFAKGLDLKTDPYQLSVDSFLSLDNMIFTTGKRLTKRNGFGLLPSLPNTSYNYINTYNDNLTAISTQLTSLSQGTNTWINKGYIQPLDLSVTTLVRSSANQVYVDSALSPNNLTCSVYTELNGSTSTNKFIITDLTTGESVVPPTSIISLVTPTEPSASLVGSPRVFVLGQYFIIMLNVLIGSNNQLQFIAIPYSNPISTTGVIDFLPPALISSVYVPPSEGLAFDAVVIPDGSLYVVFNAASSQVRATAISKTLVVNTPVIYTSQQATIMSVSVDLTQASPVIWAAYYSSGSSTGYVLAFDSNLHSILAPTQIISSGSIANITATAQNSVLTVVYESNNFYGYDSSLQTNYLNKNTVTQAGVVGTPAILVRSIGLASKAFLLSGTMYFLSEYSSVFQPTYFLMNSSGQVISKLAYENGGGYLTLGIPSATVSGNTIYIPYLYKDLIQSINKTQGIPNAAGIYSQTGINLAAFDFNNTLTAIEMGDDLNISGGMVWMYDGVNVVEQNFQVWPDNVEVTSSSTGGALSPQQYFYQAIYQWTDAQGNIFQSAPSIPIEADLSTLTPTPITFQSVFASGAKSITVSSTVGLAIGQEITDLSTSTITFTATFALGDNHIVASSVTGLSVGQVLADTTTPGNLAGGTTITAIAGNDVFINTATLGASASLPGDTITTTATGEAIQANTTITSIVGSVIGLSLPTISASASTPGDTLQTIDTCSNTVYVPTDRLTYKPAGSVKILIFRWSAAQQIYYQVTSITSPTLSNTTSDYITFIDTQADAAILGNSIIYTTGGVVEDIAPPATSIMTLFDDRLWLVDAEDPNLLWFSKQVIENTPVEMSDLFTIFVAPNIGAQGSTGPITALGAMDDKLIIFKQDAIYYMNGTGPDNTGANNQYSQPIYIMSTVGCANPSSIVIVPSGLMFQSDKGIWLLGRDLSTQYIGAPVESFNSQTVVAALTIPETNQVRFTLDSGATLMFDYYYNQWGTFTNIPGVDSCLYQNKHTYLNDLGQVLQETPGAYTDAGNPTLMQFTGSWLNVAGLQGYQRAYFFYLLGTYLSPHKLQISVAYDYNASDIHTSIIQPGNFSPTYGTYTYGAGTPYGGPSNLEQWRIFMKRQKCQSFQISMQEIYDPSFATGSGPGLTMSGLNCVIGIKKGWHPQTNATSVG